MKCLAPGHKCHDRDSNPGFKLSAFIRSATTPREDKSNDLDLCFCANIESVTIISRLLWSTIFHFDIALSPPGFLRKVFGILCTQLLVTTVVCAIFMYTDGVKAYVQNRYDVLVMCSAWLLYNKCYFILCSILYCFGLVFI